MKATPEEIASLIYTISIERGAVSVTRTMPGRWGFDTAVLDDSLRADVLAFCEEYFHRPLFAGDTTTLVCPHDLWERVERWQVGDNLRNLRHEIGPSF